MAKAEKGEQKANLYLLAIVAIVAVVGIVVLVLNSGGVSVGDDLTGQALRWGRISESACADCPGGCTYDSATRSYGCVTPSVGSIGTSSADTTTAAADDRCPRLCCKYDNERRECAVYSACYGGC